MSETTKSMNEGISGMSVIVDDVLSLLAKMLNEGAEFSDLNALRNKLKDGQDRAIRIQANDMIIRKAVKYFKTSDIPYVAYDVRGSSEGYIVIAESDIEKVRNIMNFIKKDMGYSIDTKEELDDFLKDFGLNPKEIEYGPLSPELAERMIEIARKQRVTAVKVEELEEDGSTKTGKCFVYCSADKKKEMNKVFFRAAWDLSGKSGINETKRLADKLHEKEEVKTHIENIEKNKKEAYVFSLTNRGIYIHIKPDGFEIVKNGEVTTKMKEMDDIKDYEEILSYHISQFESPVYMTPEEVAEKGGPTSEALKEELKAHRYAFGGTKDDGYFIQAEKEVRNWLEEKFKIGPDRSLTDLIYGLDSIKLEDFKHEFEIKRSDNPEVNEEYAKMVYSHLGSCEYHFDQMKEILKETVIQEVSIKINIDKTLEQAERNDVVLEGKEIENEIDR